MSKGDLLKLNAHTVDRLMHERSMTITQMARIMGCSAPNVCKILNPRKRVTVQSAQRIARILGVKVREIIMEV